MAQLDGGFVVFAVTLEGASSPFALFTLDLSHGTLFSLGEIPSDTIEVLWAPDGSGAILLGTRSQPVFLQFDQNTMLDLQSQFGSDAHGFRWLAPMPRS
jgi:hypothetical protein